MSKLISANFARLWKSRVFHVGILTVVLLASLIVRAKYEELKRYGDLCSPDDIMFADGMYLGIIMAVFIGIFIGTEYSDGTMRNKVMAGHTRPAIYLANLAVCFFAAVSLHLVFTLVVFGAGIPLLGGIRQDMGAILGCSFCVIMAVFAYAAVFLMISMLIQSKSTAVVVTMLLSMGLLMAALTIYSKLEEPEYYSNYEVSYYDGYDGEKTGQLSEKVKNPNYLRGNKRKIYGFFFDFLPSGQILQMLRVLEDDGAAGKFAIFLLYSGGIVLVFTLGGIVVFLKKDLK